MNQQDANNILDMKEFLKSLENIVSSFKNAVDDVNVKIETMNKRLGDLDTKVNLISEKVDSISFEDSAQKISSDIKDLKSELNVESLSKEDVSTMLDKLEEAITSEISKINERIQSIQLEEKESN